MRAVVERYKRVTVNTTGLISNRRNKIFNIFISFSGVEAGRKAECLNIRLRQQNTAQAQALLAQHYLDTLRSLTILKRRY